MKLPHRGPADVFGKSKEALKKATRGKKDTLKDGIDAAKTISKRVDVPLPSETSLDNFDIRAEVARLESSEASRASSEHLVRYSGDTQEARLSIKLPRGGDYSVTVTSRGQTRNVMSGAARTQGELRLRTEGSLPARIETYAESDCREQIH